MASNKTGIGNIGTGKAGDLGSTLLKIVAYGVAGGALLVSGAKALGEALLDKQVSDYEKREARREADKEDVRRIMENEIE
ncbi:MAG: hypothetical protein MJ128_04985 [Mogibacterium sp.]|nr:hypothetical protein [Mogibacterium sp.]